MMILKHMKTVFSVSRYVSRAKAAISALTFAQDADEATRLMTRDEYVHYSECRQASFTFRKSTFAFTVLVSV